MLTNKATCELAVHFNKKEHHMSDFEKIVNDTTDNLDKVFSQERPFGARSYAPSNLTA